MTTVEDVARVMGQALADARADGYKIGRQILSVNLNPFEEGTEEHDYWRAGWHAAIQEAR